MNNTETDLASGALERIYAFVRDNPWIGIATVAIWLAMRLIQSDIKYVPTVPSQFRIFCLPVFTAIVAVVARFEVPASWFVSIIGSLIAASASVYFHEAIIEAIRRGKNITIPFLTIPGAQPSPQHPVTKPLEPGDPPPPPPV